MPFSITTKDGITINDIPDDVAPDADVLRQRVAQIRQQREGGASDEQLQSRPEQQPAVEEPTTPDGRPEFFPGEGTLEALAASTTRAIRTPLASLAGGITDIFGEEGAGARAFESTERALTLDPRTQAGREQLGTVETAATIGSSAIAEPVAGIAGLAAAVLPGEEGQGAETVKAVQDFLQIQPETAEGERQLQAVGEFVQPVGDVLKTSEEFLGDQTLEITGSPAAAALAKTLPTIGLELLGLGVAKAGTRAITKIPRKFKEKEIASSLDEAVPTAPELREISSSIFKEVDNLGVTINQGGIRRLRRDIKKELESKGADFGVNSVTPAIKRAVAKLDELQGRPDANLQELQNVREAADIAAKDISNPKIAALGVSMKNQIDSFLDTADIRTFDTPTGIDSVNVGKKLRSAREVWGRAKRSELLEESLRKAGEAKDFSSKLKTEVTRILTNKKTSRFFNEAEKKALRAITKEGKLAQTLANFGVGGGGVLRQTAGILLGASLGGVAGAAAIPAIGLVTRTMAEKLIRNKAQFADQVIRAGNNAKEITRAYIKNTKKAERSADELAQLLTREDISLRDLPSIELAQEAKDIALRRRAGSVGAATTAATEAGTQPALESLQQPPLGGI